MKKSLWFLLFLIPILVFGYPPTQNRTLEADFIKSLNQSETTFNNDVKIETLTGNFVLQSSGTKEIEESAVTNTELGYVSGVTSALQTQIDAKALKLITITATAPIVGGGDLSANRVFSIPQSTTIVDGFLGATDWNTFNNKQAAITGTDGDLFYWNSGLSGLGIGSLGQLLSVSALGFPEWTNPVDPTPTTTLGDLILRGAAADERLPIGTNGYVLTSDGTTAGWQPTAEASPTTTEGDLIVRGAVSDAALPIGTVNQLLTSDGTTAGWADAPVSTTLTTKGDLQGFSTVNSPVPVGVDGAFLVANSTDPNGVTYSTSLQGKLNFASDWIDYTPIFSGFGVVPPASIKFQYRQDGADMIIKGSFEVQASAGSLALFTLPVGKLAALPFDGALKGKALRNINSNTTNNFTLLGIDQDNTIGFSVAMSGTLNALVRQNANVLIAGGQTVNVNVRVPIVGWSSGLDAVAESRKLLSVVGKGNTAQFMTTNVTPIPYIEIDDNQNAWDGSTLTAPAKMKIHIRGGVYFNSSAVRNMYAWVDRGSGFQQEDFLSPFANLSSSVYSFSGVLDLNEGDKFHIRTESTGGTLDNSNIKFHYIYIDEIVGVPVIAATLQGINSTNLTMIKAVGNAGQVIATDTPIPFIEVDDTKNEWDGTTFAPKTKGRFFFDVSVFVLGAADKYFYFYVNRQGGGYALENLVKYSCTADVCGFEGKAIDLDVGDTLQIVDNVAGFTLATGEPLRSRTHYLYITQSADFEAIVQNQSDSADRCQTKVLLAHEASLGIVTDLTFNNIEINSYYSVHANLPAHHTEGSSNEKNYTTRVDGIDLNADARTAYSRASNVLVFRSTHSHAIPFAKANATTITINLVDATRVQMISGSSVTVCKKNNTVSTTEF